MESILGLIHDDAAVHPMVERLIESGIADEQISILSHPDSIRKLLGCDPLCVIKNYTVWGAAISIGIYAIFGVAAALCQCNLMRYGQGYGIGTFLGAILAGAFVGVFIGALVGAGEAEKDTHLYLQGVRIGSKLISVQVREGDAERVRQLLSSENATGVKALQIEGS